MNDDVLRDLGAKFERYTSLRDIQPVAQLQQVMDEAGRQFQHLVVTALLAIRDEPAWLRSVPVEPRLHKDAAGELVEVKFEQWAHYWWYSVLLTNRDRPDAGIVLPAGRLQYLPERPLWCDFSTGPLIDALSTPCTTDHEVALWGQVAQSSFDTCRFLTRELAKQYMPSIYFAPFGIKDFTLRKAKAQKRLRATKDAKGRNLYDVEQARAIWPELLKAPGRDRP